MGTLSLKSTSLASRAPKAKAKQPTAEVLITAKSTPQVIEPAIPVIEPVVAPVKKEKRKPPPEVIIEGQRSVYWYANSIGQHLDKNSLALLGHAAGARCNELGIVMGVKFQKEIMPDKTKWQGRVRTYPVEILESLISNANAQTPDNTQPTEVKPHD